MAKRVGTYLGGGTTGWIVGFDGVLGKQKRSLPTVGAVELISPIGSGSETLIKRADLGKGKPKPSKLVRKLRRKHKR